MQQKMKAAGKGGLNMPNGGQGMLGGKGNVMHSGLPQMHSTTEDYSAKLGPNATKTRLCQYWLQGMCYKTNGNRCTFAHGEEELGQPQPGPPMWICQCGFKNHPRNMICGGIGDKGCNLPK